MTKLDAPGMKTAMKLWQLLSPILIVPLLVLAPYVSASVVTRPITAGVTLTEEIDNNPPLIIHVLSVDLTTPGVHVECIPGQDTITGPTGDIHQGRAEVRQTAIRHGAIAAVNGDFFPFTGDPVGTAVWNGDLFSEPYPTRSVMGVQSDGHTVMFSALGFLGELQTQQNEMTAITGVDRMVSSVDTNDLVVFTPTFGPRSGVRPNCVEVVLTGVNLPLRPSKLEVGTVAAINNNVTTGSAIPSDGVVLAALPGGQAADFLNNEFHVGDKAEFVCAIAPASSLADAVKLASQPRDDKDLPTEPAPDLDPIAFQWATVSEVVGGGPHLIVNGKIDVDGQEQGFDEGFISDPNPRTAVGVTQDGKLLLVTVDGRQDLSKGVSLADLAKIMLRIGAVNAINLDGGGSTTMAVRGMVLNSIASTGVERPVADSLCVFAQDTSTQTISSAPESQPQNGAAPVEPSVTPIFAGTLRISGLPASMVVGQTAQLTIIDSGKAIDNSDPRLLWGGSVGGGTGFVNQSGLLTALQPGQASINACFDGRIITLPLTVASGVNIMPNAVLSGSLTASNPRKPLSMTLVVGVFTPSGMPVPGAKVHLTVSQGAAASQDITTNIDGYAQTNVTWSGINGTVVLSSAGLSSQTVLQPAN